MDIVVTIVLIVVFALMLIMPYFTQKKRNQEYMNMLSGIKVGDLVKTAGGIIGKVNKISDKGEIKTVVLETGSKSEKSYLEFDMTSIYCVLKSTKANDEKQESAAEEKIEDPKVENIEISATVETKDEEPKTTKKPVAKKTSKTSSKKVSSKAKTDKK